MAIFKSMITNAGAEIMTEAIANNTEIVISSVAIGNGINAGNPAELENIISEIIINSLISDRVFVEGTGAENPSYLQVTVKILNDGLLYPATVREIGLFVKGVLFSYSWLDGVDTDNTVPTPINPDFPDTAHIYDLRMFITNDENANIKISFALSISDNELIVSMSDRIGYPTDTPVANGNTVFSIIKWVANKFTSVWTDARAVKQDNLDATISSRSSQTSVNGITTVTNTINTNVNTANSNILIVKSDVANVNTNVNTVKSDVALVKADVNTVKTNVNTTNTNLGTKSDVAGVLASSTLFSWVKSIYSNTAEQQSGYKMFLANGTFTVPKNVTTIWVTATASGGDGANDWVQNERIGGYGGGCGEWFHGAMNVTPNSIVNITTGLGNTLVGSLTLLKGKKSNISAGIAANGSGLKQFAIDGSGGTGFNGTGSGGKSGFGFDKADIGYGTSSFLGNAGTSKLSYGPSGGGGCPLIIAQTFYMYNTFGGKSGESNEDGENGGIGCGGGGSAPHRIAGKGGQGAVLIKW
jgi:hypothetical protein